MTDVGSYAALYLFLARAYLKPPDSEFLELAAEIPELSSRLQDDLGQQHSRLFDFNVYPYASVFLDPSGMLNAPWSSFVGGVYQALGLEVDLKAGVAAQDHLSIELEALAALLERQANAQRDLDILRARHGQRTLLVEQLLPWLPAFTAAVRRIDRGFYAAVARLTQDAVLTHAAEVVGDGLVSPFSFPTLEEPLDLPSIGRKGSGAARAELQTLLSPARSGLYLSRSDITRLGHTLELPVRFAERAFMLESLIGSAAERGDLARLFEQLKRAANGQKRTYRAWQRRAPVLAPLWKPWLDKLGETASLLRQIAEEH
jgi:TorA maturation chaperone TorD